MGGMDLADRLKALMDAKQVSQYRLADLTGVPQPTIQRILSRETLNPKTSTVRKLAGGVGATVAELMGDGSAAGSSTIKEAAAPYTDGSDAGIPVVGIAQLGNEGYWEEFQYPAGHGDGVVDFPSRDQHAYALEVRGDSMEPRIRRGEYVIVEPGRPTEPGDEVLVVTKDGRCMVKVLLYRRQGRIHLESVNKAHPSISLDEATEVAKIHYVAGIVKGALHRSRTDG